LSGLDPQPEVSQDARRRHRVTQQSPQSGDTANVLTLLLLLSLAQFVIGSVLDPYLMGSSLNLSPVVILARLASWGSLWGIAGAFLALPITAMLVIVLSEFDGKLPIAILLSRDARLRRLRSTSRGAGDAAPDDQAW